MRAHRVIVALAVVAYVVAALAYGVHALDTNPQYDNQGIFYAKDFIEGAMRGTVGDFFLQERKYPLGYVATFVPIDVVWLFATGAVTQHMLIIIGRIVTLLFAAGTFAVTWRIGRRLESAPEAVLLLCTSILFLLFTSAIRPHVPVAFWTTLTLLLSLRLRERPSPLRTLAAFASAGMAFATLQNGLLAFLFPVWALLEQPITMRRVVSAAGWSAGTATLFSIIGYPFLLRPLFGLAAAGGTDLGHDVGLTFDWRVPLHWIPQLLGGELVVLLFAAATIGLIVRSRRIPHEVVVPILLYCGASIIVFGFHGSTAGRFFMPCIPLLALLGAPTLAHAPRFVKPLPALLVIAVCAKLLWLSLVPNTYQQVSAFFALQPGKVGTSVQPGYFFSIPDDRRVTADDVIENVTAIAIPDYRPDMQQRAADRTACFHAVASRTTNEIVLLWNDTPWALWHVFEARALGPNMTVFCVPKT